MANDKNSPKSPAQKIVDSMTSTTKFYFRKKQIAGLLGNIMALQQRDDLSGKFARKVGRVRRALAAAHESIGLERKDLVQRNAEKFPEGHEKAGEYTPVYATGPDGVTPIFRKDPNGNDTTERIPVPDQFNVADPRKFDDELKELMEEYLVVECPAFPIAETEAFVKIKGSISDALLDLEEDAETTKVPDGFKPALALVEDEDDAPAPAAPAVEDKSEESGRTAP
jgi:hypothetical protein